MGNRAFETHLRRLWPRARVETETAPANRKLKHAVRSTHRCAGEDRRIPADKYGRATYYTHGRIKGGRRLRMSNSNALTNINGNFKGPGRDILAGSVPYKGRRLLAADGRTID